MDKITRLNLVTIVLGATMLCGLVTIGNKLEFREPTSTTAKESYTEEETEAQHNQHQYKDLPLINLTEPTLYDQPTLVETLQPVESVVEEIEEELPDIIELEIKLFNDYSSEFNKVDGAEYLDMIAKYLDKYAPDGMFISAACAQSYTEGGAGKQGVYSKSNNCFGIMATSNWDGYVYARSTQLVYKDYETAQKYGATDLFRAYDSIEDSVRDYVSLVDSGRYKDALSTSSAYQYLHTLLSNGYGHMNSLDVWMEMIQFYDLLKYDNAS